MECSLPIASSSRKSHCEDVVPYWGYEEIGLFFLAVALMAALVRLALRLRLLPSTQLSGSAPTIQVPVLLLLTLALYLVLKLRYHRPVWAAIGWVWPTTPYAVAAVLLGSVLAAGVVAYLRYSRQSPPAVSTVQVIVLGVVLGPFLEESFFRGCLLPVIARTAGKLMAVVTTALLFAAFHAPLTRAQWIWITAAGIAYGWMRLASRSTTAAALMHASYNFALFLFSAS
jgi:membrane protease YdiL (CAAX protease family)